MPDLAPNQKKLADTAQILPDNDEDYIELNNQLKEEIKKAKQRVIQVGEKMKIENSHANKLLRRTQKEIETDRFGQSDAMKQNSDKLNGDYRDYKAVKRDIIRIRRNLDANIVIDENENILSEKEKEIERLRFEIDNFNEFHSHQKTGIKLVNLDLKAKEKRKKETKTSLKSQKDTLQDMKTENEKL